METWKIIVDKINPKGVYEVSNLGRVRSKDQIVTYKNKHGSFVSYTKKGRILKLVANPLGYKYVSLGVGDNHKRAVHRLVAKAFIPNPAGLPEVNHKDCDPSNNCIDNLEWVSHAENMRYSYGLGRGFAKIRKPVVGIDLKTKKRTIYKSARSASESTGCSWKHISSCCHNKRKSTGGFSWSFADK